MSELRRVLLSRRTLLYLVIAVFLGSVFFMYDCLSEKQITLTGEELTAYIDGYPEFLNDIQNNADEFGTIAALSGGFSAENIRKTAVDYRKLTGVTPVVGENKGFVLLSGYILGDLLIAAVTLLVASSFSEERKKGLVTLVRSTKNGRIMLSVQRTGIILIVALASSILVHTGCILTATLACGDMGVLRPIQSVPEFSLCPFGITILDYIVFSVLMKALASAAAGLLLYLLSSIMESVLSFAICAAGIAAEYLFYGMILPTDRIAGLKFCNIAAVLRTDLFFNEYCNLNIFGKAIGFLPCAVISMLIVLAVLCVLCILFTSGGGNGAATGGSLVQKLSAWFSKKAPVPPLPLWEMKKVFINQKGIIILAAVVYIAVSSALQYRYVLPHYSDVTQQYYNKYKGVITEETVTKMHKDYEALDDARLKSEQELSALSGLDTTDAIAKSKDLQMKIGTLMGRMNALQPLIDQAEDGLAYSKESGIEVQLIRTKTYELLLLDDNATTSKNSLYIILSIVGIFAGICANENRSNMNSTLRTSLKGRGRLTAIKLVLIGVTSIIVTASIFATQVLQVGEQGFNDLEAAAQSIACLRFMPFEISLLGYLILMFAVRMISAFAVGAFVMLVSRYCRSSVTSICINSAILIVPAVLSGTGILDLPSAADLIGFTVI